MEEVGLGIHVTKDGVAETDVRSKIEQTSRRTAVREKKHHWSYYQSREELRMIT